MGSETAKKEQERWTKYDEWKRKVELERKFSPMLDSWLDDNDLPKEFMSEIMEEIVKPKERNKDDVGVDDMLITLSPDLRCKINNAMDEKKIDSWLKINGVDEGYFKSKIIKVVQEKRGGSVEFVLDPSNILPILPQDLQSDIVKNQRLPLDRLKKVPLLKKMNEESLKQIYDKLCHKNYKKGKFIIIEDEHKPLKRILFIVDGVVSIEKRYCLTRWELKAGDIYGEELHSLDELPPGTEFVKAKSATVDVHILEVKDLYSVVSKVSSLEAKDWQSVVSNFKFHNTVSSKYGIDHLPMLKKVPELENLGDEILKTISKVLKPTPYTNREQIIKEKDELHMMFFVTRGKVAVTRSGRKRRELYADGKLYGKELLDWALVNDTPETSCLPSSAGTATADSKDVNVLILNQTDLTAILSDTGSSPPTDDSESEYVSDQN